MKDYDLYIFDFDGTLSDTVPGVKNSVKYALSCYGIEETDDKKLDYFIGPPLYESFTTVYSADDETANGMIEKYRERYKVKACEESTLYDGIKEMLSALKAKGKKLAIASSKPLPLVEMIAKSLEIYEYFDYISAETYSHIHSDKCALITDALNALEVSDKSKVIMIGDRFYDIEGANKAGIDSAGALYGFGEEEELKGAGATYLLSSPKELVV